MGIWGRSEHGGEELYKKRLEENLKIFDWSLTEEETHRISAEIPQCRTVGGEVYISEKGPIKSLDEMWDGEI